MVVLLEVPPEEAAVDVSARRLALVVRERVGDVHGAAALEGVAEAAVQGAVHGVRGVPVDDDLRARDLVADAARARGRGEAADEADAFERVERALHGDRAAAEDFREFRDGRRLREVPQRLPYGRVCETGERLDESRAVDGDRVDGRRLRGR